MAQRDSCLVPTAANGLEAFTPGVRLVAITPELARQWLAERNRNNRKFSKIAADKIKAAIQRGEWVVNGETIIFDEYGMLANGQHRLDGIAESGVTVKSYVAFGVTGKAFVTIDSGRPRQLSDVIGLSGETNSRALAAALKVLFLYERRLLTTVQSSSAPTRTQLLEVLEMFPGIRESVSFVVANRMLTKLLAPGHLAAAHFVCVRDDVDTADAFFGKLATGTGLEAFEPVYLLRERLLANRQAKAKLAYVELFALLMKAWIATRTGRAIRTLRWTRKGDAAEEFPYSRA